MQRKTLKTHNLTSILALYSCTGKRDTFLQLSSLFCWILCQVSFTKEGILAYGFGASCVFLCAECLSLVNMCRVAQNSTAAQEQSDKWVSCCWLSLESVQIPQRLTQLVIRKTRCESLWAGTTARRSWCSFFFSFISSSRKPIFRTSVVFKVHLAYPASWAGAPVFFAWWTPFRQYRIGTWTQVTVKLTTCCLCQLQLIKAWWRETKRTQAKQSLFLFHPLSLSLCVCVCVCLWNPPPPRVDPNGMGSLAYEMRKITEDTESNTYQRQKPLPTTECVGQKNTEMSNCARKKSPIVWVFSFAIWARIDPFQILVSWELWQLIKWQMTVHCEGCRGHKPCMWYNTKSISSGSQCVGVKPQCHGKVLMEQETSSQTINSYRPHSNCRAYLWRATPTERKVTKPCEA